MTTTVEGTSPTREAGFATHAIAAARSGASETDGPTPAAAPGWCVGRALSRRVTAVLAWLTVRAAGLAPRLRSEAGTTTPEYAIATIAAVAFAGLLVVILRSDEVRGLLLGIIREALER